MTRVNKPIQAQLIEYACDCGKGVYRLTQKQPICSDYYHSWQHACSHCGDEKVFNVAYPVVELKSRIFVLKDSTPAPYGPAPFKDFAISERNQTRPLKSNYSPGIFKFVPH